jgi:hypothetical protein
MPRITPAAVTPAMPTLPAPTAPSYFPPNSTPPAVHVEGAPANATTQTSAGDSPSPNTIAPEQADQIVVGYLFGKMREQFDAGGQATLWLSGSTTPSPGWQTNSGISPPNSSTASCARSRY